MFGRLANRTRKSLRCRYELAENSPLSHREVSVTAGASHCSTSTRKDHCVSRKHEPLNQWVSVAASGSTSIQHWFYGLCLPGYIPYLHIWKSTEPVFSYKLRYVVGFELDEMAISTNPKPTIFRNLYENTGAVCHVFVVSKQETRKLTMTNDFVTHIQNSEHDVYTYNHLTYVTKSSQTAQ